MHTGLFRSFILGGFECSTHIRRDGRRLDLIHSTRHDELAQRDYQLLQRLGIKTARDAFRWHLIERQPGVYDFSSALPMLRAARDTDMQVVWDLWHYGWPDHVDVFSPEFPTAFARFAAEAARHLSDHTDTPLVCPVNEISFFSWAGGEGGIFFPFAHGRGDDMKRQLVRATIAAVDAMRAVNPRVRIHQIDPIINVVPKSGSDEDIANAASYRDSQFQAWDMILGRLQPELGGREDLIDAIGVNYYIHNQFVWGGRVIAPSDLRYRHVREMLREVHARYRRPLYVAETGIEDDTRPAWLRYMCREVLAAMAAGVPVEGVCLYPIVNHPGWDDDRHCHNGLVDYAGEHGDREVYQPLADEVTRQLANVAALAAGTLRFEDLTDLETSRLDWAAHVMEERTDDGREPPA